MISKIENMTQLKLEIIRLQSVKAQQEALIESSILDIAESLKPVNLLKSVASSVFGDKEDRETFFTYSINRGMNYMVNLFAEKVVLKDRPEIVKIIGHFLINNLAAKFISFKSGSSIFNFVKNIFETVKSKMGSDDSEVHEESYTEPKS